LHGQAALAAALLPCPHCSVLDTPKLEFVEHSRSRTMVRGTWQVLCRWCTQPLVSTEDEASASVPWREAFPPLDESERPGRMLRAARIREDLTQMQLARLTGIPQRHLSEMEHGKRAIGKERAKKLAEVLHVNYRMLL
jgi:ribosome-binding protein aMBF1 (putative translation factor)